LPLEGDARRDRGPAHTHNLIINVIALPWRTAVWPKTRQLFAQRGEVFGMAIPIHDFKKRGFTTREAGSYIGRSASWLRKKRLRGTGDPGDPGPRYLKTVGGGSVIYLKEDLDAWLDKLAGGSRDDTSGHPSAAHRLVAA
jgi:hypothetical protein